MSLVFALALWLAAVLGISRFSDPSRPRRALAVLAVGLCFVAALAVPAGLVFVRFLFACLAVLVTGRSVDLLRGRGAAVDPSAARRLWLLVAFFDVREAKACEPAFAARERVWLAGHLVVMGLGAWLGFGASGAGWTYWAARWLGGLGFLYGLIEVLQSSMLLGYARLGVALPRINERPILSRTLAEFWGRRWNRVVSGWLRAGIFEPITGAERTPPRAAAAVALTFVASALLHLWVAWVPLGLCGGVTMASFFVVHGALMLAERGLGVRSWPALEQRAWTLAWLLLTSPSFIEPMMQIFAGSA
ncbi:hypothetical protein G6O69_12295 [Pseudenhygromyxa sp. WMMC2535]|uniref:MBOAT family protein n=1 Tax=Pseudenhygromyxa sp. WMMC2535 TaxID=2712867 RepID=UPI00155203F8|nr:MBOAT family protein [Pseudenhygromyxa sp. WMMC2535]NVB38612.1 hypothetical protein [Pseudenhygromyxa sp. WMMC2535]